MIVLQQIRHTPETIRLSVQIDTALCVGAGGSTGSLADKPIVRTGNGRLLIPGSQVKGRLRHECEKLARGLGWPVCESPRAEMMCPQRAAFSEEEKQHFLISPYQTDRDNEHRHHCLICQIFGNPSLASMLEVDDLVCETEDLPEVIRPGVTINRRRRTAEDAKLYFLETSPPALKLSFTGWLHLYPHSPPQTKLLISAAFKHIHAFGGRKSGGLGWLTWQGEPWNLQNQDWSTLLFGG